MKNDSKVLLVIHDHSGVDRETLGAVSASHAVRVTDLFQEPQTSHDDALALVFSVDLNNVSTLALLRQHYGPDHVVLPRLFILRKPERRAVIQAYSAGAHAILSTPVLPADVRAVMAPLINASVERLWGRLTAVQQSALKVSLKLYEKTQADVLNGGVINRDGFAVAAESVIAATSHESLPTLINSLRDHHAYTFRHSMFVTGTLVAFAKSLQFRDEDLQRVTVAGLVHDVGKIITPSAILDKPGPLNSEERRVMQDHPAAGAAMLMRAGNWPDDLVSATLHHHERIDGKGYPDALAEREIGDLTRLVCIADVFSALIDKRAYKKAMPGAEAYEAMCTDAGHFDQALLSAFEPIAQSID